MRKTLWTRLSRQLTVKRTLRFAASLGLILTAAISGLDRALAHPTVQIDVQEAPKDSTVDALAVLRRADEATRKVQNVVYEACFEGRGPISERVPKIQGRAHLAKLPTGKFAFAFKGRAKLSDGEKKVKFHCGSDRRQTWAFEEEAQVVRVTKTLYSRELLGVALYLWMREYCLPEPFGDELEALATEIIGREKVEGEPCVVVSVVYRDHAGIARWAFSEKDGLPRRVERVLPGTEQASSTVLTLSNLEVSDESQLDSFTPDVPAGWEVEEILVEEPELMSPGEQAPEFRLRSAIGEKLELADRKGKPTLLFFWATWCSNCKDALPRLQKLNDRFADRGLEVWAISTWDFGNPAGLFEEKELTIELLLEGDRVAKDYGVGVVPTTFLIDGSGRIEHVEVGFDAKSEARFAKSLRALTEK
ncbi:MAG: TlpA disulfide reductase family protein [Planctomycetota bacterium]